MAEEKIISKLRKEFSFLKKENVLGVLLFGSRAKGEKGARDVDICLVAPKEDSKRLLKRVYQKIDVRGKKYDVYCFEELPLYLKWEIIDGHKVIWSKDKGGLYEYFYYFRKLYDDQKYRMAITKEEILKTLHAMGH